MATENESDVVSEEHGYGDFNSESANYATLSAEEAHAQYMEELKRVEEEIQTLQQVLNAKYGRLQFLKQQLGITVISDLRTGVTKGVENMLNTDAYQKTSAAVRLATERTSTVINDKWNILKQTNAFKTFEDKLGIAYTSVRGKLVRSATISGAPSAQARAGDGHGSTFHWSKEDATAAPTTTISSAHAISPSAPLTVPQTNPSIQLESLNPLMDDEVLIDGSEIEQFVQTNSTAAQPSITRAAKTNRSQKTKKSGDAFVD